MPLNAWIILTVVGIGILHVIGGIMLLNTSHARPMENTQIVEIRGD
jgi:hypothetical protein